MRTPFIKKGHLIKILCLSGLILVCSNSITNALEKAISPSKPIIVLKKMTSELYLGTTDTTIWQLNWKNPAFVLYDDGLVIFRKKTDDFTFFSVQLTPDETKKLRDDLGTNEQFMNLEEFYNINDGPYQPINTIAAWQDQTVKSVTVVGQISDLEEDRKQTPTVFLKIYDQLTSFQHPKAQLWQPEKVKIVIAPYPGSQGEPAAWPKGWPDLNDTTTQKITNDSYAIYLNGENTTELEQLLTGLKENQAVLINEKPWYITPERFCFPGEESWVQR